MTHALSEIRGRRVEDVVSGPSATTLRFVDGWGIAIFNDYRCMKAGFESSTLIPRYVIGRVLEDAYVDEWHIMLSFDGGVIVEVDLREQAYHGPEAAEIFGPAGEEIIVR